MKTIESVYKEKFQKYFHKKEVTPENLDYQDAIQDAMVELLQKEKIEGNIENNIRHMARCNAIDKRKRVEAKLNVSEENAKEEVIYDKGEMISLNNAIDKALDATEKEYLELYTKGYTLEEIVSLKALKHKTQALRVIRKAWKKIDGLKVAYLYESRYVRVVHHGKREKIYYPEMPEANGLTVNRKYLCLDQTKEAKRVYRQGNYDANLCPVIQPFEIYRYLQGYGSDKPYYNEVTIKAHVYSNSCLLPTNTSLPKEAYQK